MAEYISLSPEETEEIGKKLALSYSGGKRTGFVALFGDLGAGKTALTRGFVSVLSPGSRVKSPTFTIVNEYVSGSVPVFHFDLYRLSGSDELEDMGYYEYLERGICIVEWSERLEGLIPDDAVKVYITKNDDDSRTIRIEPEEKQEGFLENDRPWN